MRDATQAGEAILRVAEALPEDVGRGRARVDPAAPALLGAAPGDGRLVTGGRTPAAGAAQAPPGPCGRRLAGAVGGRSVV
jgi:hypothetical protein